MDNIYEKMQQTLNLQKKTFINDGVPSNELRVDRLNRLKTLVEENRYDFIDALNSDFGNRSKNASLMTWTKNEKRSSNFPFGLLGAKSYIRYEPLGTVGMISPWNFPVNLAFGPLAAIFAAGNQVMHKPSELTPETSNLMKSLCDSYYDESEFATFLGGPEVGAAFSKLHFDHLLYTVASHLLL